MKPPIYFQDSEGVVFDLSVCNPIRPSSNDLNTIVFEGNMKSEIYAPIEDVLAAIRAAGHTIWTGESARAHIEQSKEDTPPTVLLHVDSEGNQLSIGDLVLWKDGYSYLAYKIDSFHNSGKEAIIERKDGGKYRALLSELTKISTEPEMPKFFVGCLVVCTNHGLTGVVDSIDESKPYAICVKMWNGEFANYTIDGKKEDGRFALFHAE